MPHLLHTPFRRLMTRNRELTTRLKRTVAPTALPVQVSDVRAHLEVEHDEDDVLISNYIRAATHMVEEDLRVALITQTWEHQQDDFWEDLILLRRPPVSSVSSVVYIDTDGTSTTLAAANYQTDLDSFPARIQPAFGEDWPDVRTETLNGVVITFVAGFGATHLSVPFEYKQLVILAASQMYQMRCSLTDGAMRDVPIVGYSALRDRLQWTMGMM